MALPKRSLHVVNTDDAQVPQIVLDEKSEIHWPLTLFTRYLAERYATPTLRAYLNAVVAYFVWNISRDTTDGEAWEANIEDIRQQVVAYLSLQFSCKLKNHRSGVRLVEATHGNLTAISHFLSGLRAFYNAMTLEKRYQYQNPLKNWLPSDNTRRRSASQEFPRMPLLSGVAEPNLKKRLTDSFFVIINDEWTPRVIDDPTFPTKVFSAGERFDWKLREKLIARMLFETGARISEICGLTVGDWGAKGFSDSSTAFNKGSNGRRVKFVRWSSSTTKLLRKYFDSERLLADPSGQRLSDYMRNYRLNPKVMYSVPLFLTNRGMSLSANSFRDLYWRPALKESKLHAHIHQARHWYVTMAIREIYEASAEKDAVERRTVELIKYMNWRSGKSTLEAYEHYFDRQRHGEIQDKLHRKLDANLKSNGVRLTKKPVAITAPPDPELDYLLRLGGQIED